MRIFLLYFGLVGLPVLGIIGLLRMGQTLSAPISLAGTWNAELRTLEGESTNSDARRHPQVTLLTISQSGARVVIMLDDNQGTTFVGSVQGMTVDAGALGQPGRMAIRAPDSGATIRSLRARIDRQAEPDRLIGVLVMDRGSLQTEVPLIAIRRDGVRKGQ